MDEELWKQKKETLLRFIGSKEYRPMKAKAMAMLLQVPKEEREEFRRMLAELVGEGRVSVDTHGKYKKMGADRLNGVFAATQRGFGFVAPELGEGEAPQEDIFIPESGVGSAMHGDRVLVQVSGDRDGKRREGVIIEVLERNTTEIVGFYEKSKNYGFVVPDNGKLHEDIFIPREWSQGAVSGHKVVVKLTSYGDKQHSPEGRVVEILGHVNDPGVDILSVVRAYGLPEEFPPEVMAETERIPDELGEAGGAEAREPGGRGQAGGAELAGRLDLRELEMVTIDGEDAKDLDDAVSLEKVETEEGIRYRLGVHIADVTHYVQEGSALDKEALNRGTSVYLVDRVIPMLPHRLSNGICSLNAGKDRLALSCLMELDGEGTVLGHRIAETVIQVDRRMSYTEVQRILDGDAEEAGRCGDLAPLFFRMEELAGLLREKRHGRGSLDFDFPESKIILDKAGHPVEVRPYERSAATRIIEDFMLIANETVAEDFFWQEMPFLYRSHETPDPEKMQRFCIFLHNFGYSLKGAKDEIHPKELQKVLEKVEGKPEEALISRIALRSLKQARYTVESVGHFGLAARYYCHFTSPIRRYPDLQIHRIIKENLRGGLKEKRMQHYEGILPEIANHCSRMERRADEAERDVEKMKKAEYMGRHIGEIYDGVISGVAGWGFYVELPNTIEGLVRAAELTDDYYAYDEEHYQLVGEHRKRIYKLGQKVRVVAVRSDKLARTVEFTLADEG